MSITFPSVAISNLIAPLRNTPASLLNPPQVPPRSILASFDWAGEYGASAAKPNVNVLINLQGGQGGAQQQIDQIRSVKIDNLGNPAPVYVYFLDTTDTIVAPANTLVWEPVVTNAKIANVILLNANSGAGVGKTKVYFCNFVVPPYVNAEISQAVALFKGSPTLQTNSAQASQPLYSAAALGDSTFEVHADLLDQTHQVFSNSGGLGAGFYYITSIYMDFYNASASGATVGNIIIANNTGANVGSYFFAVPSGANSSGRVIYAMSGLQLRWDATIQWFVQSLCSAPITGGAYQVHFSYTFNPN